MFLEPKDGWPAPLPWRPRHQPPRLTRRDQTLLAWVIGFNLVMLLAAPIAGVTLWDAAWSLFGR